MKRAPNPLSVLLLLAYAAVSLVPVAWLVVTSLQDPSVVGTSPPRFLPGGGGAEGNGFQATLASYERLFRETDSLRYLVNSAIVAAASTIASVALGALAAYGFSRSRSKGLGSWKGFILATRLLPPLALAVPISWLYAWVGIDDTHFGLILVYTCFNLSLSTWMMTVFFDRIPKAQEEAAWVEGYSRWHVLFKIALPQTKSGLIVTGVFCWISAWNEFAYAMTLTSTGAVTMPVSLAASVADGSAFPWGTWAAASVIFLAPATLVALLMRRHVVTAVSLGVVRGR